MSGHHKDSLALLAEVTECARCEQEIVRCSCDSCPFHGWRHLGSGRHLCAWPRARLVQALAHLAAVA